MAGTNPTFNEAAFRDGIKFAMKMGAPTDMGQQATFIFAKSKSYPPGTRLDREGRPLDPTIVRTETTPQPDLIVDCAVEFEDPRLPIGGAQELPVGRFVPTRLTVTVFEEDYQKVKDAREIKIGGDLYLIAYTAPPFALFNVGFRQIAAYSRDET